MVTQGIAHAKGPGSRARQAMQWHLALPLISCVTLGRPPVKPRSQSVKWVSCVVRSE